ncbi:MAG: hypothetical protein CMJ74_11775 [Planctomycetaceae bacterium]|nr:hypothetical protein [Planctomycetaceae bacterium]|tara:strand:- start:893 stop:1159 length:267 start_codon:yes stop_codon:yes gene_type:complete
MQMVRPPYQIRLKTKMEEGGKEGLEGLRCAFSIISQFSNIPTCFAMLVLTCVGFIATRIKGNFDDFPVDTAMAIVAFRCDLGLMSRRS